MPAPRTLYDKIWDNHVIEDAETGQSLIYIDRHLAHDGASGVLRTLFETGRTIRRPDCTLATPDHMVPTVPRTKEMEQDQLSYLAAVSLEMGSKMFGYPHFGMRDQRQGIVHIIGPEQGFTLPGVTCVCGDSHTSTHGAFGCLAFGIGSTQVEHVLATQTLLQTKSRNMRITVNGELPLGVTSKDLMLHIIRTVGAAGGTGCVIEYAGPVIRGLSMEARMTMCNMSIEAGARAGMIAPDDITVKYLQNRPLAPKGENWEKAVEFWRTLHSDEDAIFDKEVTIDASEIAPTVTWGTSPQHAVPITSSVPDPLELFDDPVQQKSAQRALEYMDLTPGTPMEDINVDQVFIGSCTNSRIEDLRAAAQVILSLGSSAHVAPGVQAWVVPGSGLVKKQAEAEGFDSIFLHAGFEWREPGCSMCVGMNGDTLSPGKRCASTSNRNFEGRQGPGGRTHLLSPPMAAAAALTGKLTDVRKFSISTPLHGNPKLKVAGADDEVPTAKEVDPKDFQIPPALQRLLPSPGSITMPKFTILKGIAAPLHIENVDTDLIIPVQFLRTMSKKGLSKGLFYNLRVDPKTGQPRDFILNREPYTKAKIIVSTGANFGCGSSREHAVWSLNEFGVRCIIAPSFGDIFYANCFQNLTLPVRLSKEQCALLADDAEAGRELEINLEKQEIRRDGGESISFEVDSYRKHCLLNGLDDVGLTLTKLPLIEEFERKRKETWPWLDAVPYKRKVTVSSEW